MKNNNKLFSAAFFIGVFLAVGFSLNYKVEKVSAASNCFCSAGGGLFTYSNDAEYTTSDSDSCRIKCTGVANGKYFSFSNVANLFWRRIYNCLCVNGSIIPFYYPLENKSYVANSGACDQQCANQGTKYYSYSDVANLGTTKVTKTPVASTTSTTTTIAEVTTTTKYAGPVTTGGLVPCGKTGQEPCTLCHLVIGIQGLIDYGRKIMTYVAFLMLAVGGILYTVSAGNEKLMTQAKDLLFKVLIGFAIILGAWIIVNYSLILLSRKDNLGIQQAGSWSQFKCSATKPATK